MLVEKATLGNGWRVLVYYLGKDEVMTSGVLPKTKTLDDWSKQPIFDLKGNN